jgi:RHS repeat-associated protein
VHNHGTNPIPQPDAATRFFKTNPTFQLAQNSRLGHQLPTAILYQGLGVAISNNAISFRHPLYDSHVRPRCTGKERDAETGLDFFGARYFSGPQGRFTSPDKPFADQKIPDPQSWNLYAYVRNNPLKYVDEQGRELKLAIYNTSSLSQQVVTRVAERVAGEFREAGVKNVTFEITNGSPGAGATINQQLNPFTSHSEILELRKSDASTTWAGSAIPPGEGGHNNNGDAAVNTSVVTSKTADEDQTVIGVANISTHELSHEALGHKDTPDNIMNSEGAADPKWIFNPDLSFTPGQQQLLQQKYNRSGEVDKTPKPPEKKEK